MLREFHPMVTLPLGRFDHNGRLAADRLLAKAIDLGIGSTALVANWTGREESLAAVGADGAGQSVTLIL